MVRRHGRSKTFGAVFGVVLPSGFNLKAVGKSLVWRDMQNLFQKFLGQFFGRGERDPKAHAEFCFEAFWAVFGVVVPSSFDLNVVWISLVW